MACVAKCCVNAFKCAQPVKMAILGEEFDYSEWVVDVETLPSLGLKLGFIPAGELKGLC